MSKSNPNPLHHFPRDVPASSTPDQNVSDLARFTRLSSPDLRHCPRIHMHLLSLNAACAGEGQGLELGCHSHFLLDFRPVLSHPLLSQKSSTKAVISSLSMGGGICSLGQAPALETKNKEGMHKELHLKARSQSPPVLGTELSAVGTPKDSWGGLSSCTPFALERLEAIRTASALKMEHCCPA